jgi:hypothetical protein
MAEPCMSCGDDKDGPPRAEAGIGRCLTPSVHHTPQSHQVWVWLDGSWQIRGTGLLLTQEVTEEVDMACDWSDYKADVGVSIDQHMRALEYKAFCAGWQAARHGSERGVLR